MRAAGRDVDEFRTQFQPRDHSHDPGWLWHTGSQDTDLSFPLFVALWDHNTSTLQTDRQTDVMLS